MKKIFKNVSSLLLIIPVFLTVACSFFFLVIDLSKLGDYDWTQDEPYFNGNYPVIANSQDIPIYGNVSYLKNQRYIQYKNFNTGYKNLKGVKKQAVTGVPLNSAFLPNGNYLKDFGENSKSLMFQPINSILTWDSNVDHDAKYNQSDVPLLKTKNVAGNWVSSQDSQVKSLIMGLAVRSTSGSNSIVGSNRIFDYSFNNWQYADRYAAWAGAADEGIIVPPAADAVNAAHINGTKIYGQIFLDGYHGLKKAMLRDFLQKDFQGNYKIVNVLINMAKYMGFDGWFYNNEPNGTFPNGFIMNSQESVNIINQFNNIVANSNDQQIHNLEMISYKNQGTLQYLPNNQSVDQLASDLANSTKGVFLQDFYTYPNQSQQWSQNHPQYNQYDINNMYNLGGWVNGKIFYNENRIGTRDVRELTQQHFDKDTGLPYTVVQKEEDDMNNNKWGFNNKNTNSLAVFAATTATDLASMYLDSNKLKPSITNDIYATEYANYYDDMVYTGRNRALSNNDKGSTSWNPDFDVNGKSYGIGDIKLEKTVLFDDANGNNNVRFFKTNFSTGQGQMFAQDNGNQISSSNKYPWNNKRLVDTQPTYKWDIRNSASQTANNQIMGYYDYYNAYQKGNSIALGAPSLEHKLGFDDEGKINKVKISNSIDWNIMGTNFNSARKQVDLTYKISSADQKLLSDYGVDLIITLDNGTVKVVKTSNIVSYNGWNTLHTNQLDNNLPRGTKIAKIGLRINPLSKLAQENEVNFNVGQLKISNTGDLNSIQSDDNRPYITNLNSEYAISRGKYYNLRLNWTPNQARKEEIAYYEIYLQTDQKSLMFLGTTTNTNFYAKNLILSKNSKIIIKTINKFDYKYSNFQGWDLV